MSAVNVDLLAPRHVDNCGTGVRADPIIPGQYTSPEFMKLELERLWPRVWNIGGWRAELSEPGDFVTHSLGSDSILFVLQPDRSVKAFFNVCQHRGDRKSVV